MHCARNVPVKLPGRLSQVRIARDVVPIEHGARFMAADLHGDGLRHSRANEVPDGASAEIVPDHPDQSCFLAGGQPGFPEVPKPGALKPSLSRVREQIGDDSVEFARQRFDALDLVGQ